MKSFYPSSLPLTRWWWFSQKIDEKAIEYQLKWLKEKHFGGVEIAFVYPYPGSESGPEFLSPEWSHLVAFAKKTAVSLGLSCDFTFGTLWPFCGSFIPDEDCSKTYEGLSKQEVLHSWEDAHNPGPVKVLDHLDRYSLERYSARMGNALKVALEEPLSAIFCDSWEVETKGLWKTAFEKLFNEKYGYDILPFITDIDEFPEIRYDYRKLISKLVLEEFYIAFSEVAHNLNSFSRVQCHGAPTDILAAYAAADVPESEALLFDPEFSVIAASAAALTDKTDVSCETFTCLYGWVPRPGPAPHAGDEIVTDLKLLADAVFANGVNQVIWHGMPYNPENGEYAFYAGVHVGEKGALSKNFKGFNTYMANVSRLMKKGKTYSQAACYLPLEDTQMAGGLPEELLKPSGFFHWELHYQRTADKIKGYRPLWVTAYFLEKAEVENNILQVGEQKFSFLYIDSEFIDFDSLKTIVKLAEKGLPVYVEKYFKSPGNLLHPDYNQFAARLMELSGVPEDGLLMAGVLPVVEGELLPDFWCRQDGEELLFFFANPLSKNLTYPMEYGYSLKSLKETRKVIFNYHEKQFELELVFEPNQSLMIRLSDSGAELMDNAWYPSPE